MCSIFGVLDITTDVSELRGKALELSGLLRHRGPDWSGIWNNDNAILAHERLSIVDLENGAQPLFNNNRNHILAVNGEIYNHKQLAAELTREPHSYSEYLRILVSVKADQSNIFSEDHWPLYKGRVFCHQLNS